MEKNIEDLIPEEAVAIVAEFTAKYLVNPESLRDETAYPSEDLIDLLTIIHYLERSGVLPNAREVYGEAYKELENEIGTRLGDVPYLT